MNNEVNNQNSTGVIDVIKDKADDVKEKVSDVKETVDNDAKSGKITNDIVYTLAGGKDAYETISAKERLNLGITSAAAMYGISGGNTILSAAAGIVGQGWLSSIEADDDYKDNHLVNYLKMNSGDLAKSAGVGMGVQALTHSRVGGLLGAAFTYGVLRKGELGHDWALLKTAVGGIGNTVSKAPEKLAEMAGDTKGAEEYKAKREAKTEAKETKNAEYDKYVEKVTSTDNSEKRTSERFTATTSAPSSQSAEKTAEKAEEQCDVGV